MLWHKVPCTSLQSANVSREKGWEFSRGREAGQDLPKDTEQRIDSLEPQWCHREQTRTQSFRPAADNTAGLLSSWQSLEWEGHELGKEEQERGGAEGTESGPDCPFKSF